MNLQDMRNELFILQLGRCARTGSQAGEKLRKLAVAFAEFIPKDLLHGCKDSGSALNMRISNE